MSESPASIEMISKELPQPVIPEVSAAEKLLKELDKPGPIRTPEGLPIIAGGEPWLYADERVLDRMGSEEAKKLVKSLEGLQAKFPKMVTEDILTDAFLGLERMKNKESDPRKQAEIESYQEKIYAEVESREAKKAGEVPSIKIENPESPEGQAKSILGAINLLEERATAEGEKIEDSRYVDDLKSITKAIASIPDTLNSATNREATLSRVLSREIRLREKLELSLEARRRLHNRKIEVTQAEGDLAKLGAGGGPEGAPEADFTNIRPVDWYILVHQDDLFAPEAGGLGRELVVPVAEGLKLWQFVGESWGARLADPIPGAPQFREVLNSFTKMQELRSAIATKVGKNAERLAFDIFTTSMTLEKWDKLREKKAGKNGLRDLAYFDLKRIEDYYDKGAPAGPDDTIGAYFALAHQGETSATGHADYQKPAKDRVRQERLKKLAENAKCPPVFQYSVYDARIKSGLMVGDLWETSTAEIGGEKKQFAQIAVEGSLKNIPFLEKPDLFYRGYFGFTLGSIDRVVKNINKLGWDPKRDGLLSSAFWGGLGKDMERLGYMSPSLNTRDRADTAYRIGQFKVFLARGIFWDLLERKALTQGERGDLLKLLESSGYITHQEVDNLKHFTKKYRFPWSTK